MDLFDALEHHRARAGLTVTELARASGLARWTYLRIAETNNANVDTLAAIARGLRLPLHELIKVGELAPGPEDVALARCRDLLRWDGTARPGRLVRTLELEWCRVFRGGAGLPNPQPVRSPAAEGEEPVGVEGGGLGPVEPGDVREEE